MRDNKNKLSVLRAEQAQVTVLCFGVSEALKQPIFLSIETLQPILDIINIQLFDAVCRLERARNACYPRIAPQKKRKTHARK